MYKKTLTRIFVYTFNINEDMLKICATYLIFHCRKYNNITRSDSTNIIYKHYTTFIFFGKIKTLYIDYDISEGKNYEQLIFEILRYIIVKKVKFFVLV